MLHFTFYECISPYPSGPDSQKSIMADKKGQNFLFKTKIRVRDANFLDENIFIIENLFIKELKDFIFENYYRLIGFTK